VLVNGRWLGWLFAAFTCLYVLTSGGHFYASDDVQKFEALDTLLRTGQVWFKDGWAIGLEGRHCSWFALGTSLLMLPGYGIGRLAVAAVPWLPAQFVVRFFITLQNAVITAGLVTLLAGYARWLGYRAQACVFAAVALGLGTMAWPYAKSAWSEPGSTLMLFGAFVALHLATRDRLAGGKLLVAGVLLAGAVFVRQELAAVIPGALVWLIWRQRATPGLLVRGIALLAIPLSLVAALTIWYNLARYGQITGFVNFQSVQDNLVLPPGGRPVWALLNLWHYTFNPSDGLFWFAPAVWLGVLGARRFVREQPEATSLALVALLPLLFFFTYVWGLSDWAWGLRYAYVFQPFLCLPAAALWQQVPRGRVAWGAIVGVGVAVQLLAVTTNFNYLLERERLNEPSLTVQQIMTQPAHSPLWLAAKSTPATLAGGIALLSLPRATPADIATYRQRAQFVPDVWPALQWLTPMPRWAILASVFALLGGLLLALFRLRGALAVAL
jgi:hypothetical protein